MSTRVAVFIYASDPLSAAGAKAQLLRSPAVEIVGAADFDRAQVALVVADAVDDAVARVARAIQRDGVPQVVLVASRFEEEGVVKAVAAGVTGFLRRGDATAERLVQAICEAHQGCSLPEGLLRRAATVAAQGAANGGSGRPDDLPGEAGDVPVTTLASGLSAREVEVLRLVADGYDTSEVADRLAYSESTIKGVLAKLMSRLGARNRSHAVALALRQGLL